MVIVIQRLIQEINNGKWDELEPIDKKFTEIENKLGYPPKKRYRCLSGPNTTSTIIIERQWESLAKMEKISTKAFLDPEYGKLESQLDSIIKSQKQELLVPHPPFPQ